MTGEFALNRALAGLEPPFSHEAKIIANERAEFHLLRFDLGFCHFLPRLQFLLIRM